MEKPLTPKQEKFCQEYLKTGNASEAYRRSYNTGDMKPETINRKAKELLENGKIAARLHQLRKPAVKRCQVSLEAHLDTLQNLRELAEFDGNYPAAINAEVARGKACGLYDARLLHRRDKETITAGVLQRVLDRELTERDAAYLLEIAGVPLPEILKIELTKQQNIEGDPDSGVSEAELDAKFQLAVENVKHERNHFLPERAAEVKQLKEAMEESE